MKCYKCGNKKLVKSFSTVDYVECGLDNVTITNVLTHKCNDCGAEYTSFGPIEEIHKLIKNALISKKNNLNGKEIAFLRKEMGYSKKYFAFVLGVSEDTVKRWESDKHITSQADRSIKILAQQGCDLNHKLHDEIVNRKSELTFNRLKIDLASPLPQLSYA